MKKELSLLDQYEKEFAVLGGITNLLNYDRATIMPPEAIEQRADHIAYVSKQFYGKSTSGEFKGIIRKLYSNKGKLSTPNRVRVEKYHKMLRRIEKIPLEHVDTFSRLVTKSSQAWEQAKARNNFKLFAPYLQKLVEMRQEEARLIDGKKHPYDVLLDEFEEGMTVDKLKKVFGELKAGLLMIFDKLKDRKAAVIHHKAFSRIGEEEVAKDIVLRILGDRRVVLGESVHPFSDPISPDDIRLTTAYKDHEPLFSYTSTSHESGHALYELNFDSKYRESILYAAPSIGLHESQSKFWEDHIMKHSSWWSFYYPFFKKAHGLRADRKRFMSHLNEVKASPIRIEADEVTYPLHVIIRFELEVALMEGSLKVKDLPKAWNEKYKDYLGIDPKSDAEGCLQDTHWSLGYFGYFPTYAIGVMYAASLFKQLERDHKSLGKDLGKGDLRYVKKWLRENVHKHGSTLLAGEIVKKATGKELGCDDFLSYLREKYL